MNSYISLIRKRISYGRAINTLLIALLSITTTYPFWYVLVVSVSTYKDIIGKTLLIWPINFTMSTLRYIISSPGFIRMYGNTLYVVIIGTFMSITLTTCIAYGMARKVPGHRLISFFIFFTLLFSGGMIPTFLVVRSAGLLNTLWSLIIPQLISPFYVFLLRNFFKTIPESLIEAASIEGSGTITTLVKVVIPVSLPGIATIALFYGVFYWNQFFDAILYISDRSKWTLQVLLREILISVQPDILGSGISSTTDDPSMSTGLTVKMATVVMAVVPIMLIYPFIQRYFVKGIMVGAIKG